MTEYGFAIFCVKSLHIKSVTFDKKIRHQYINCWDEMGSFCYVVLHVIVTMFKNKPKCVCSTAFCVDEFRRIEVSINF